MPSKNFSIGFAALLAIFAVTIVAVAQTEKVLFSFACPSQPIAGLISDASGNLYGTTYQGGSDANCSVPDGCGFVFELSPTAEGSWKPKGLHTFRNNGKDGYNPASSLIFDAAGNLYGTTVNGGVYNYGTVFEVSPLAGGAWHEKVLHSFNNNDEDGYYPYANLILDSAGNLYGTTMSGGFDNGSGGTAFELSPTAEGGWTEKILHNFGTPPGDGHTPLAGLIFDADGNLYGTTAYGGYADQGTVFEVSPTAKGGWTEKVLHMFDGLAAGALPEAGLIFDAKGNLYGTTAYDGPCESCAGDTALGTVFELTPRAGGIWTPKILYAFKDTDRNGIGARGSTPRSGLILDASGNLYGTTEYGGHGANCGTDDLCGTVFELRPAESGLWSQILLYSFGTSPKEGWFPHAGVIFDAAGNLYGTTSGGGKYGKGTVFEITP